MAKAESINIDDVLVECTVYLAKHLGSGKYLSEGGRKAWKRAFDLTIANNIRRYMAKGDTVVRTWYAGGDPKQGRQYVLPAIRRIAQFAGSEANGEQVSADNVNDAIDRVIPKKLARLERAKRQRARKGAGPNVEILAEWCDGWSRP